MKKIYIILAFILMFLLSSCGDKEFRDLQKQTEKYHKESEKIMKEYENNEDIFHNQYISNFAVTFYDFESYIENNPKELKTEDLNGREDPYVCKIKFSVNSSKYIDWIGDEFYITMFCYKIKITLLSSDSASFNIPWHDNFINYGDIRYTAIKDQGVKTIETVLKCEQFSNGSVKFYSSTVEYLYSSVGSMKEKYSYEIKGFSDNRNITLLSDDTIGIESWDNTGDVSIPETILGYEVSQINESAFKNCTSLRSINIPNTIKNIEDYAFSNCTSLKNITIPDSVTNIGRFILSGCTSLETITIPFIGETIKAENRTIGWLFGTTSYKNNLEYIPSSLKEITITRESIIAGYEFYDCSSIQKIVIPQTVTSIGDYAFNNCSSLTEISIPQTVTSIGDYAFNNCLNLIDITFNGTLSEWGKIKRGIKWCVNNSNSIIIHCIDGDTTYSLNWL